MERLTYESYSSLYIMTYPVFLVQRGKFQGVSDQLPGLQLNDLYKDK